MLYVFLDGLVVDQVASFLKLDIAMRYVDRLVWIERKSNTLFNASLRRRLWHNIMLTHFI